MLPTHKKGTLPVTCLPINYFAMAAQNPNWGKDYTDFWVINIDQTPAELGHVMVTSKHGQGQKSLSLPSPTLKAISPISCKEGYVLAEDTAASGMNKYKECLVLKQASLFHKMGISSYGGRHKKTQKKRSSSSKRKPTRYLRVKRSRSGSRR